LDWALNCELFFITSFSFQAQAQIGFGIVAGLGFDKTEIIGSSDESGSGFNSGLNAGLRFTQNLFPKRLSNKLKLECQLLFERYNFKDPSNDVASKIQFNRLSFHPVVRMAIGLKEEKKEKGKNIFPLAIIGLIGDWTDGKIDYDNSPKEDLENPFAGKVVFGTGLLYRVSEKTNMSTEIRFAYQIGSPDNQQLEGSILEIDRKPWSFSILATIMFKN